jgi:hypothetical protein
MAQRNGLGGTTIEKDESTKRRSPFKLKACAPECDL